MCVSMHIYIYICEYMITIIISILGFDYKFTNYTFINTLDFFRATLARGVRVKAP